MAGMQTILWGCFLLASPTLAWNNQWDKPLNFRCPRATETVSRIKSMHNNYREDRLFDLKCSPVTFNEHETPKCSWTGYVNGFDQLVHFACPGDGYINGMSSYHSNGAEDRRWKFRCCSLTSVKMESCIFAGWTNVWDGPQDYRIPKDTAMKGVISMHNNYREDRLFDYMICKIGETIATPIGNDSALSVDTAGADTDLLIEMLKPSLSDEDDE